MKVKFIKNKFLFIILISVVTLVLLIVGAISMYQDTSSIFESDGYIIATTAKTNKKYYFSANTKYKENVDDKITFSDKDANKVSVEPASFVHYMDGNISFLQKGALVNLSELNNPMVTYYNITDQNVIVYENGSYSVSSNGKKISIESFVGRISDNKYIVAGKNLSLKVPKVDERIQGDYFEVLFIEEGIVRIDNREASYQVTAQDSYIYVGNDITISLGDGKIFSSGEAKMLLSQITINGDENIDLDVVKENGGGGSGDGTGSGGEGSGDGAGVESGDGNGSENGNGESEIAQDGTGTGTGTGTGNSTTASPQIELIEAEVTATTIDLSLQLNNVSLASGDIVYYLRNVSTGDIVDGDKIDMVNGTFKIRKESLTPSTEYVLTIGELDVENGKQYFQKIFKTEDLGISLEKVYATSDSLSYTINFEENTDVTLARVSLYHNENIVDQELISRDDLNNYVVFLGLISNTNYSVSVDMVWIDNAAYSDVYSINRIDTTLKLTPSLSGIKIDTNTEEVKFNIQLEDVVDPDKSIVSYTYNVYKADDITIDNLNPEVVYSVVKNDKDLIVLNLNEIDELKTGVDYRLKIVAQYDDNEMIREVSTDYSSNFLIKSKPNVSFELSSATMNRIMGTLSLIDANCSVPISGRSCLSKSNTFTLRYYKMKESENNANDTVISFNSSKLTSDITLSDLSSNTTYAMKLFGDYYDDNNVLHSNVQIGDTLYFTTDKSVNLHLDVIGDNVSGKNKDGSINSSNVVTFDARLSAPKDSNLSEEVSTITLNLYSGRYNTKEKLIGKYTMTSREEIEDFFNNITITNNLFTDVTDFKVGKLNSLANLIKVTNNVTNSLNSDYTVEVEDVYDEGGVNKLTVEDNIYTFHLTSSYYLDTRIETNPSSTYITATPILKKNLTEDEYEQLSKAVRNLDELNDDTVVGLIVENSLSDMFVDSAFEYEKVVVQYNVYNSTTKKMAVTLDENMGNKYQPKTQIIYLDPSDMDDGSHFTRGYNYDVYYTLNFVTEDGSNPSYTNDKLHRYLAIERQKPIYTQYISTSTDQDITYRYTFKDIDGALASNNFYYKIEGDNQYYEITDSLIADNEKHDVTLPIGDRVHYELLYTRKNTSNVLEYVTITNYDFEKEYKYEDELSYTIINDNDNMLKIRLENNDITSRAAGYRVNIKARDNKVSDYSIYFLDSKLSTIDIDTGEFNEDGEKIVQKYKYISIDYANISKFMGHEMIVSVLAYYDSGLVGINQKFNDGMIFKVGNKFLNVYNGDVNFKSYSNIDSDVMGIYLLRGAYHDGDDELSVYNQLRNVSTYNPLKGASYYDMATIPDQIGVTFRISATNAGMIFNNGKLDYSSVQVKALKKTDLKTDNNISLFDAIIPTVGVNSTGTINSVKVSMTASGIYGNAQFVKDGVEHRKVYLTFYSDEDCEHLLDTITSDVVITGDDESGYSATIKDVEYQNLTPNTTYYFTVSAYIDGKYTQLYNGLTNNQYVTKTYIGKTLGNKDILSNILFHVEPSAYHGESSKKTVTWKLGLKNTSNYKIRFELFSQDGTINEDTGEVNYKEVMFDGNEATSCDKLSNGLSSDGYVSNCYISVDREEVAAINNKNQTYQFLGDNFVFGDGYYKLIVYAIPYTNGSYVEEQRLILYQNDSLSTTGILTVDGITSNIKVSALEEVAFDLSNTLDSGYRSGLGYYIEFVPTIVDKDYVMKYGKYTVTLQDEKRSIVESCTAFVKDTSHNENTPISLSPCRITLDNEVGAKIQFAGLSSNTLYYIDLSYQTYRNNVGFTEEEKVLVVPFTDFIYTPIASNITLGTVTASLVNNKSVALTYNGSTNLTKNIVEVSYTISLKGASNKVSGTYSLDNGVTEIFTLVSSGLPRFTIDVSDNNISSNTAFRFQTGNTYIISTQYYYINDNHEKVILEDQQTHNTNFTTILNL